MVGYNNKQLSTTVWEFLKLSLCDPIQCHMQCHIPSHLKEEGAESPLIQKVAAKSPWTLRAVTCTCRFSAYDSARGL